MMAPKPNEHSVITTTLLALAMVAYTGSVLWIGHGRHRLLREENLEHFFLEQQTFARQCAADAARWFLNTKSDLDLIAHGIRLSDPAGVRTILRSAQRQARITQVWRYDRATGLSSILGQSDLLHPVGGDPIGWMSQQQRADAVTVAAQALLARPRSFLAHMDAGDRPRPPWGVVVSAGPNPKEDTSSVFGTIVPRQTIALLLDQRLEPFAFSGETARLIVTEDGSQVLGEGPLVSARRSRPDAAFFAALKNGIAATDAGSGGLTARRGESSTLVSYAPIPMPGGPPWRLALATRNDDILSALEAERRIDWILLLLLLSGNGVLGVVLYRSNSSRIRLAEESKRLRAMARAEAQIHESEARLRALVDNLEEIVFSEDAQGQITYVSPAVTKVLEIPQEAFEKQGFDAVLTDHPINDSVRERQSVGTGTTSWTCEASTGTGRNVLLELTQTVIGQAGQMVGMQYVARDVTEKTRQEKWRIQAEKMAGLGQLSAGIAHELRNPLGIIDAARFSLEEQVENDDPQISGAFETIARNVARAGEIITNLLTFSRPSAHDREWVDVNGLLQTILTLARKDLEVGDISVTTDWGDVPPIWAGLDSLKHAFLNMLLNAAQSMVETDAPKTLEITTWVESPARLGRDRPRLTVAIKDNGGGIGSDDLPQIFDPFFSTKSPGQGTGLGLSLAHSAIESAGGDVKVDSALGKGTRFTVTFPLALDQPQAEQEGDDR